MVRPAPAVFSMKIFAPSGTFSSAKLIASPTRAIAPAGSLVPAEPGWKQKPSTPSAVVRSSSLARPSLARSYFSGSGDAVLRT